MTPDPIIGRVLFTDGIVRPVFRDDAGHQYVIDRDGHTRCYGAWLPARPERPNPIRAPLLASRCYSIVPLTTLEIFL